MKRPVLHIAATAVLEEAFDLLRHAPTGVVLRFYVGSVPFVLAACFFVLDLGRNPMAVGRGGAWALAMALLYLWMKLWQASFAAALRRELGDAAATPVDLRGRLRAAVDQLGWQGFAPWALTVAALAAFPFAWIYAFFQGLSAGGDARTAWEQATAWPRQNHLLLGVLGLFSLVVALNTMVAIVFLPYLASALLGFETTGSMAPENLLVVTTGATYLLVGPVSRAAYVLRGFYSDSRASGEDLKARIGALSSRAALLALAVLLGGGALLGVAAASEPVDPQALDRELDRAMAGSDYDWARAVPRTEASLLARLVRRAADGLESVQELLEQLIERFLEWLRGEDADVSTRSRSSGIASPRALMLLACALVLAGLIYLVTRRGTPAPEVEPVPEAVDIGEALAGDDAAADRLPFDEWLETSHELFVAGDSRRAARAVYLATLSFMAHSELILLAKHKSNRDYRDELSVRARRWPKVVPRFSDSIQVVERVWYGRHPAGERDITRLRGNLEEIREEHDAA